MSRQCYFEIKNRTRINSVSSSNCCGPEDKPVRLTVLKIDVLNCFCFRFINHFFWHFLTIFFIILTEILGNDLKMFEFLEI